MANVTSGSIWSLDTPGTITGQRLVIRAVRVVGLREAGGVKLIDASAGAVPFFEDCYTGQNIGAPTGTYSGPWLKYDHPLNVWGMVMQLYSCAGRVYIQVDSGG